MNNTNVDLEVEDLIKRFLVSERKSIINLKGVESSHRINFATLKKRNKRSF